MNDEIKVNSENTPRKNLATLGQVKDALDKRDEKIGSLKGDLDSLPYSEITVDTSEFVLGNFATEQVTINGVTYQAGDFVLYGVNNRLASETYYKFDGKPLNLELESGYKVALIFYNEDKTYKGKSGWITSDGTYQYDGVYVRIQSAKIDNSLVYVPQDRDKFTLTFNGYRNVYRGVITVGQYGNYPKFSDGIKKAVELGHCDVYVKSGTYDIISELTTSELSTQGIEIGNDVNVYFDSDAKLVCNYTGDTYATKHEFSILKALPSDFKIYGMNAEASRIRYIVHDETSGVGTYVHEYHDCVMKFDNSNNDVWHNGQCIGGGLGEYSTILIDGGFYSSVGLSSMSEVAEITYHNPASGNGKNFKNKVTIRNCYFNDGTCYVSALGDSTKKTDFYACNNSVKTVIPYSNGSSNVICYQWNNVVRN